MGFDVAARAAPGDARAAPASAAVREAYVAVPMPSGFRVEYSELEGPVFADARGHTLYIWPFKQMRAGVTGEQKGKPLCYGQPHKVTAGMMSPYPGGVPLPSVDPQPACTDLWPPVMATRDDKPLGKWTVLERTDGTRQWAYDEQPLYTSVLDRQPGDVMAGTRRKADDNQDSPAGREPVGPPSLVAPGFAVKTTLLGRMLTTAKSYSVYVSDQDTARKSLCDAACAQVWRPMLAPLSAQPVGEWTVIERSAGVRQWAYRNKPLYTYARDTHLESQQGSDVPGWHNVYTQHAPPLPAGFTVQDTIAGQVVADSRGMTVYKYNCGDDSLDQLSCDHPAFTQVYRLAICGAGDPARCRKNWPYVPAADGVSSSRTWSVLRIDPDTGRLAAAGAVNALSVWAYRGRPIYTYSGDYEPGDVNGDSVGEWRGKRNGYVGIWLRSEFFR
jgi:predicted lipoprotein with Yx(FWY)xxD motif